MAYKDWLYVGAIIGGRVVKNIDWENKNVYYLLVGEDESRPWLKCKIATLYKKLS